MCNVHVLSLFLAVLGRLVGSQFPNQGLNLDRGSESAESQPLDHQATP